MWFIIILILVGVLLLIAELILLPGLTIAGICALLSYGGAAYVAFTRFGVMGGTITICSIVAISIIATILALRAKTWQKFSLNQQVDSTSQPLPQEEVEIGQRGITITRLAPGGNISIEGNTYEAKSLGDVYVDPRKQVEVVGFENFTVIVRVVADPVPEEAATETGNQQ